MRTFALFVLAFLALIALSFVSASPDASAAVMESELDASVEWIEPMFLEADADADAETEVDAEAEAEADADADAETETESDSSVDMEMEVEQPPANGVSPAQTCEICILAVQSKIGNAAGCAAHKVIASDAKYRAVCSDFVGKNAAAIAGWFNPTVGCVVNNAKVAPCPAPNTCFLAKQSNGNPFCPPPNPNAVPASAAAPSAAAPTAAGPSRPGKF